jgi:hypothetical protein
VRSTLRQLWIKLTGRPSSAPQPSPHFTSSVQREPVERSAFLPPAVQPLGTGDHLRNGVKVVSNGALRMTLEQVDQAIDQMVTRPDVQARLLTQEHELWLVPDGQRIADLPGLEHLRSERPVNGISHVKLADGRTVTAVTESSIIDGFYNPKKGSALWHELAHLVHHSLTAEEREAIDRAFAQRRASSGPWTDTYGSQDPFEYFAESALAFLDRHSRDVGRGWLRENDPEMLAMLERALPGVRQ